MSFLSEIWAFLRHRKKFWLLPIVLVMLLFGGLASPLDVGELNCVVEVRTKLFPSRLEDKDQRADLIRDRLSSTVELGEFGVWLILSEGSWSQT